MTTLPKFNKYTNMATASELLSLDPVERFGSRFPVILDLIFDYAIPSVSSCPCMLRPVDQGQREDFARFKVSKAWNAYLTERQGKGKDHNMTINL